MKGLSNLESKRVYSDWKMVQRVYSATKPIFAQLLVYRMAITIKAVE